MPRTFDDILKVIGVVGTLLSFLWAVYQWREEQESTRTQLRIETERNQEQRRIEAQRPFLDKQLSLYVEIAQVASQLATRPPSSSEWQTSVARFWELYAGELALVENKEVEAAMVELGRLLEKPDVGVKGELQQGSLALAAAIRRSLDQSWGINIWSGNPN